MCALPAEIGLSPLHPAAESFFAVAIDILQQSRVPFLLGGAYAMREYTGIGRKTKDLDVFIYPRDCERVLACFAERGYVTELTDSEWLAKIFQDEHFVDVIFSSANAIARVDEAWFDHAVPASVFERPVLLVPPEEMIWSKAFVMDRERYDGADIAHLVLRCGKTLDWDRLLARMDQHWELLLVHVLLFQFTYPEARDLVPRWLVTELVGRIPRREPAEPDPRPTCRGALFSKTQYRIDFEQWGFLPAPTPAQGAPVGACAPGSFAGAAPPDCGDAARDRSVEQRAASPAAQRAPALATEQAGAVDPVTAAAPAPPPHAEEVARAVRAPRRRRR